MNPKRAFVRAGLWASLIGLIVLGAPALMALMKPGPADPRLFTNLMLTPVFLLMVFAFGGFIGMMRELSRAGRSRSMPGSRAAGSDSSPGYTDVGSAVVVGAAMQSLDPDPDAWRCQNPAVGSDVGSDISTSSSCDSSSSFDSGSSSSMD